MAERPKDIRHPDPQEKRRRAFLGGWTRTVNGELVPLPAAFGQEGSIVLSGPAES
jgi:hypothetical protein